MSSESATAAKKLLDSVIAGDLETASSTLHAECVIHEPENLWYGGDWKGPDGFAQILGLMTSKLDIRVDSYELYEAGDVAVMNAQITFTAKPNGRSLNTSVVEIYKARDGQLIDMDIFYKDTAAVLALAEESS